MQYKTLVEETRANLLENVYAGVICGVNDRKEAIYRVGDIQHKTYFRSASKPIQALPAFLAKIDFKYGLSDKEAALLTASQRGETYHIEALESMQEKLNIEESSLFCPPAHSLNAVPRDEMIRRNIEKRRLYHNCAGKHMGFIATCRELGLSIDGYWKVEHPLQRQILQILSYLSETPLSEIHVGIDGCGVPVFAIPLHNMAIVSLKLACPDLIEDVELREAVERMTNIMNNEFNIVASEHFICSALLEDRNIVAKGGAKGVYCLGLKKERLGFALKILDGSEDVWPNVIASILEQIDYANKATIERVRALRPSIIKSDGGIEVGAIHEVFKI
ncbi:asparaginase [Bacillus ndiopicus]|uniref:asparaginase n=1 Tax=Bacillus ndiopicus TaxID=1347368 RepID=UPI0005A8569F|nr:asparaginase [Bacillus ndiopicus]